MIGNNEQVLRRALQCPKTVDRDVNGRPEAVENPLPAALVDLVDVAEAQLMKLAPMRGLPELSLSDFVVLLTMYELQTRKGPKGKAAEG